MEAEKFKLLSLNPLFRAAEESSLAGKYAAIGAFNVNFYAQALGILEGLLRAEAPGIVQASKGAVQFQGGPDKIKHILLNAARDLKFASPLCLHLDHGDYESAVSCINGGFSSVMIDYSTKKKKKGDKTIEEKRSVAENAMLTEPIVLASHKRKISVEGEMGVLAGQEEDVSAEQSIYPSPEEVFEYAVRSGVDAEAVACGTCHGPVKKFKRLETELLRESYKRIRDAGLDTGLVLHGSSTIPIELVMEINNYGGRIDEKKAGGIPMNAIKEAIKCGVRKVNIDTDLRLGITATLRKFIYENAGIENKSIALGLIKAVFDGKFSAFDKDGKPVDPTEMTDPRSYLQQLMNVAPSFLREDYTKLGDDFYAEAMNLVKDRVANHVRMLVHEFGSAGLAGKVMNYELE